MMTARRRFLAGLMTGLTACTAVQDHAPPEPQDASVDASSTDSGPDADGSTPVDAAVPDAGPDADGSAPVDAAVTDSGPVEPRPFENVAAEAGITAPQWMRPEVGDACWLDRLACEALLFTGGVAVGDYDGDGWPDVFVTRIDAPDHLYRNLGDGTFEEVGAVAGVQTAMYSNGAAWADINDDGLLDLAVSTVGDTRFHLYINQGDGTFREEAQSRGFSLEIDQPHLGTSVCFGDYDGDGWLDAFTGYWGPWLNEGGVSHAALLRNVGHLDPGAFEEVTTAAGVEVPPHDNLGHVLFTPSFNDLDGDGWQDLILVSDFGLTKLFWNEGDGTFVDAEGTLGGDIPDDENGMGLAVGDYDNDGHLDWFVTSIFDDDEPCDWCNWGISGNRMYRNLGNRQFEDATDAAGVRDGRWGWGAVFWDYDQDGDLDLVMGNGWLEGAYSSADQFWANPMRAWRNEGPDTPMTEVAAELGLDDTGSTRSLVAFDYDGDGDPDLFVTRTNDTPLLYRNDAAEGHWLKVRLHGRGAEAGGTNRFGLGAQITVRVTPEAPPMTGRIGQCGYLTQSILPAHFGLGDADTVHEVRVWWPVTGHESVLENVPANTLVDVHEPSDAPTPDSTESGAFAGP